MANGQIGRLPLFSARVLVSVVPAVLRFRVRRLIKVLAGAEVFSTLKLGQFQAAEGKRPDFRPRGPLSPEPPGKGATGRGRARAGILRYETWSGNGSLAAFVISLNLHRRHLNESQRAIVGAKAKPMFG